jgi:hypothetical protein
LLEATQVLPPDASAAAVRPVASDADAPFATCPADCTPPPLVLPENRFLPFFEPEATARAISVCSTAAWTFAEHFGVKLLMTKPDAVPAYPRDDVIWVPSVAVVGAAQTAVPAAYTDDAAMKAVTATEIFFMS